MAPRVAALAVLLALAAPAGSTPLGLPAAPPDPQGVGDLLRALGELRGRPAAEPALPGAASLTDAIAEAYAALGLAPPSHEGREAMQAREAGLDPAFARGLAVLVAAAVDRLLPLLGRWTSAGGEGGAGNEGLFLFRDEHDLVLVGGPGPNTYRGNTAGGGISADAHLLTVDVEGDDLYLSQAGAASGQVCIIGRCGNGLTAAVSLDALGQDRYHANDTAPSRFWVRQGAGMLGGLGILVDLAGDDTYAAEAQSLVDPGGSGNYAAQGSGYFGGLGVLLEATGADTYRGHFTERASGVASVTRGSAQGGAQAAGAAAFADLAGDDRYVLFQAHRTGFALGASAGAAVDYSHALFLDLAGHDAYLAAQHTEEGYSDTHAQGVGEAKSTGVMVERAGNDAYQVLQTGPHVPRRTVQGAALDGQGLLVDSGGVDTYSEPGRGNNAYWSYAPYGAGLDVDGPAEP